MKHRIRDVETRSAVLALLASDVLGIKNEPMTSTDVMAFLGVSRPTAIKYLKVAVDRGWLFYEILPNSSGVKTLKVYPNSLVLPPCRREYGKIYKRVKWMNEDKQLSLFGGEK